MAADPQLPVVGALALQFGRSALQSTTWLDRVLSRPSWALRATPRGSAGPPDPEPEGRVARFSPSPGAPTVKGRQVVPSVVGGVDAGGRARGEVVALGRGGEARSPAEAVRGALDR